MPGPQTVLWILQLSRPRLLAANSDVRNSICQALAGKRQHSHTQRQEYHLMLVSGRLRLEEGDHQEGFEDP
jgi:hypothetical protein